MSPASAGVSADGQQSRRGGQGFALGQPCERPTPCDLTLPPPSAVRAAPYATRRSRSC